METVFVGKKPLMNYVMACVHLLATQKNIQVIGRGRLISKVVDVVQVLRRLNPSVKVVEVSIGSEEREVENRKVRVSTMTILLEA